MGLLVLIPTNRVMVHFLLLLLRLKSQTGVWDSGQKHNSSGIRNDQVSDTFLWDDFQRLSFYLKVERLSLQNSMLWTSSSSPASIHINMMVTAVSPTPFPQVGYSILMFISTDLSVSTKVSFSSWCWTGLFSLSFSYLKIAHCRSLVTSPARALILLALQLLVLRGFKLA